MVRCLLVALLVAFGCGRSSHPAQLSRSGVSPGDRDAGAPGIGVPDAGVPDAGEPDAGTAALDCAPYGTAQLAWELVGYQNPANVYLASLYSASGDDGLDGVVVRHTILSGQEETQISETFGPDGGARIGAVAGLFCHSVLGC